MRASGATTLRKTASACVSKSSTNVVLSAIDIRGLGLNLVERLEKRERVDERARLLCSLVEEPPSEGVCELIGEYEHAVKAGEL
jgi:hypothetical protein